MSSNVLMICSVRGPRSIPDPSPLCFGIATIVSISYKLIQLDRFGPRRDGMNLPPRNALLFFKQVLPKGRLTTAKDDGVRRVRTPRPKTRAGQHPPGCPL